MQVHPNPPAVRQLPADEKIAKSREPLSHNPVNGDPYIRQIQSSLKTYFEAVRFNFYQAYYSKEGNLPKMLSVYMLYFLTGSVSLITNSFNLLYNQKLKALGAATIISAPLVQQFTLAVMAFFCITVIARILYRAFAKNQSTTFSNEQAISTRTIWMHLIELVSYRNDIFSIFSDQDKKNYKEATERNASGASRDFFSKCNYFMQSIAVSIITALVVSSTIKVELRSGWLFQLKIIATLTAVNILAYLGIQYFIDESTQKETIAKNTVSQMPHIVHEPVRPWTVPTEDQTAEDQTAYAHIHHATLARNINTHVRHETHSNNMLKALNNAQLLEMIGKFFEAKITKPLLFCALISCGVGFAPALVLSDLGGELLEAGIPMLTQGTVMASVKTNYDNLKRMHEEHVRRGLLPSADTIAHEEYFMLESERKGEKNYFNDAVHAIYLAANLSFITYVFYQHLAFLEVYSMDYALASAVPKALAWIASFSVSYPVTLYHLGLCIGFFLCTSALRYATDHILMQRAISSPIHLLERGHSVFRTILSSIMMPIAGLRVPRYSTIRTLGYRDILYGVQKLATNIALSLQKLMIDLPLDFISQQLNRGDNIYNAIFSNVWCFTFLAFFTGLEIFSFHFQACFLAGSVVLSFFANRFLTPSKQEYQDFEARMNNAPELKTAVDDHLDQILQYKGANSLIAVRDVRDDERVRPKYGSNRVMYFLSMRKAALMTNKYKDSSEDMHNPYNQSRMQAANNIIRVMRELVRRRKEKRAHNTIIKKAKGLITRSRLREETNIQQRLSSENVQQTAARIRAEAVIKGFIQVNHEGPVRLNMENIRTINQSLFKNSGAVPQPAPTH